MSFLKKLFSRTSSDGMPAKKETRDNYRCSPTLKMVMMAQNPGLKVAQMEALTWLTTASLKEASAAICPMMGKTTLEDFITRLRTVDPIAADYLAQASSPPGETKGTTQCKAYQSGHCVVQGKDTGPCSWTPSDWESCNVVGENRKFYGTW